MGHVALKKRGEATSRFFWLPESMADLSRGGPFIADVLKTPGAKRIGEAAEAFSFDWASRLGLGHLRIAGIPLPSLVRLPFKFRLNFLFMLLEFALQSVERESPDSVVLSGLPVTEHGVLRHAFGSLGVPVEEGSELGIGGIRGFAFRVENRISRVAEVTIPRYITYLKRVVRADRTPPPREDSRILLMDSYSLAPDALRYLRARGVLLHVPDNDRGIRKILRKAGVPFRSVALKGKSPADWPSRANFRFPPDGVASFKYQGIPFFPLIEEDVRRIVWELAPRLFSYCSIPEEGFRKIILRDQFAPEGKILLKLAKQAGIRTVILQHGMMVGVHGYLPMDADTFVVWGEDGRRWIEEKGVAPDKVKVIGCPRLDGYGGEAAKGGSGEFKKRLLVVFESVEYAGEDSPIDNYRFLRWILDAVGPLEGWQVVIRFHPAQTAEEKEICRRLVRPYGPRVRIAREVGLARSLEKADVVATEASTVGVEALLRGKLLLVVRALGFPGNPYAETDLLPQAGSPEEMRELLLRWERSDAARREAGDRGEKFLQGYLRREEEPASVRFWKYCLA